MDSNTNEIERNEKENDIVQISVETNNNFEPNKETCSSGGGDMESTQSEGTKASESREERIKRLKDKSEAERQRKYTEILESQRVSNELRLKQQEDRRKKIEELKQREEERKKKVEQRRLEMDAKEKEKNEGLLRRTKEREARAAILQKQIRMMPTMTQSMTLSFQNRMTTSMHSSGASSGSEKCMKVYNRSSSGCDVDLVPSYVAQAASNKSKNSRLKANKQSPQVPDGFIEVDNGVFIPANTRHAGCFVPYKGPTIHRVKGVLAWGPPSDRGECKRGSSVSWWAGMGEHHHPRASSAHASLIGSRGCTHVSTPQNLHKLALDDAEIIDIDISCIKTERSESDAAQKLKTPLSVKMMKTMSLRCLGPTSLSSNQSSGKDSVSPRPQNRSSSRLTTTKNNRVSQQSTARSVTTTPTDQALYDRLSKPRSGSQPPKNRSLKEPVDNSMKNMSSSFIKQTIKTTPRAPVSTSRTVPSITLDKKPAPPVAEKKTLTPSTEKKPATTIADKKPIILSTSDTKPATATKTEKKPSPQKRKSLPTSGDSGLTPSPVSEVEPAVEVKKDVSEVSEVKSTSCKTDEASVTKVNVRKQSKNLQSKEPESMGNNDTATESKNSAINEEEMYRLKLAEQRRLAREAKEKMQEEQRKIEEEAKQNAAAEKKRIEEETRLLIEEEAKRRKQMEEEEEAGLERHRLEEETEKVKKEEVEREMEETRLKKSRTDDSDRMERKRRLEKIMSRVKKPDESSSFSNEESNAATSDIFESSVTGDQSNDQILEISLDKGIIKEYNVLSSEEPMEAWTEEKEKDTVVLSNETVLELNEEESMERPEEQITDSPSLISDNVLNLPGPQSSSSYISQSQITSATESISLNNDQAPQFKSRLLQSMMARGRLANNDSRHNSLLMTSTPSLSDGTLGQKRKSLILPTVNGDLDTPDFMSHSRSYNNDMCKMSVSMVDCAPQSRNGLSHESQLNDDCLTNGNHHSDTDNEVTLSSFNSNHDHPQLPHDSHHQDRGTDLHSDSSCSRLVTDERPSPVPSRPLESS